MDREDTFFAQIEAYITEKIYAHLAIAPPTPPAQAEGSDEKIGILHRCMRYVADVNRLYSLFAFGTGEEKAPIRAWMLERTSTTPSEEGNLLLIDHHFSLIAYYSVADKNSGPSQYYEYEHVFQSDLDRVSALFHNDLQLGGIALRSTPFSVSAVQFREISGVLCRSAQITFSATEVLQARR